MLVKEAGLGLQNPVTLVHKQFESSQCVSIKLFNAVTGETEFSSTYHIRGVIEKHSEGRKARSEENKIKLSENEQDCTNN